MPGIQRAALVVPCLLAACLAGAPAALAKAPPKPVVVPAGATLTSAITVTWKGKKPRRGATYAAEVFISNRDDLACSTDAPEAAMRATKSGYTVTVKAPSAWGAQQWCPGKGHVRIWRNGPGRLSAIVARGAFTVAVGPGQTAPGPPPPVPVKITLLGGSTLTASAPGRPDRSGQLTGTLRGGIPSRFKPNTDIVVSNFSGALTPFLFGADPLCPGVTPPTSIDSVASSQMTLLASGQAQLNLVLSDAPSQVFGCGPAGAPTGTTTIPLAGKVGPDGLLKLNITGSVGAIDLPGGSQGGLAANLVLNVDLSGKG